MCRMVTARRMRSRHDIVVEIRALPHDLRYYAVSHGRTPCYYCCKAHHEGLVSEKQPSCVTE